MGNNDKPPVQLSQNALPGANRGAAPVIPLDFGKPPLMKVGFNYPWIANIYGNHIGPNRWKEPPSSQTNPVWQDGGGDTLGVNLKLLAGLKIAVVRMFILCHGDNYRPVVTSYASGTPAGTWDVPASLDPLFTQHFKAMLKTFQGSGLQIIPSLVDFKFPNWEGRDVIFKDAAKRKLFFDTVLDPLLAASADYKSTIYAWEVMNEPSWCTRSISPPLNRSVFSLLSASDMTAFLQEAVNRIEAAGFPSTVGHRFAEDMSNFPTGNKRQFHYYWKRWHGYDVLPDDAPFPKFSNTNAFVGEFDSDPTGHGEPWPECDGADVDPANTLFERLKVLARKSYELVLFWPDLAGIPGDRLSISPQVQASLTRFTKGLFLNGVP